MKLPLRLLIIALLYMQAAPSVSAHWFQTVGGDIHVNGQLDMGTPTDPNRFASIINPLFPNRGDSGVISIDASGDAGAGSQSPPSGIQWVVPDTPNTRIPQYQSYFNRFTPFGSETPRPYNPPNHAQFCLTPPPANGVWWLTSSNIIINGCGGATNTLSIGPNRYYVFLVDSHIVIHNKIDIDPTSFVMFIAGGDISVSNSVLGGGSLLNPDIEGVFMADGEFVTQNRIDQLFLEGAFIAHSGFDLGRRSPNEAGLPAETFIHNPAYLLRMPNTLRERMRTREEVAP